MPSLKKLTKDEPIKKRGKIIYDWKKHEKLFITNPKIQVLNLPVETTIWIGAKDSGKTRSILLRILGKMIADGVWNAVICKKYKINAADKINTSIWNILLEIENAGFKVPYLKQVYSKTFFEKTIKSNKRSQSIEFASMDDVNTLNGIEAPHLGKYCVIFLEEMSSLGDNNIPEPHIFELKLDVIKWSIDRSNRKRKTLFKEKIEQPKFHYALNAWDDHPIVVAAEELYPEDEFLSWVIGVKDWKKIKYDYLEKNWKTIKKNIIKNNMSYKIDKENDIAYVRITFFANPTWKDSRAVYKKHKKVSRKQQLEDFWNYIKSIILSKDYKALCIILGLKQRATQNNKTYVLDKLETCDTYEKIKKENYEVIGYSGGWDIDIRRKFVYQHSVFARKLIDIEWNPYTKEKSPVYKHKIFILPCASFEANGGGKGQYIPEYMKNMLKITQEKFLEAQRKLRIEDNLMFNKWVYVDDPQETWLSNLMPLNKMFILDKAKKQKDYKIHNRQDYFNDGFNNNYIIIDEKNKDLLRELNYSFIKEGSDKRYEGGMYEKMYDHINAAEAAIYPWRFTKYNKI